MVEIHSNFTAEGSKTIQDGVLPSNHAERWKSRKESTIGRSWAFTSSAAFSPLAAGSGWEITSDRAFECPTPGIGRWA
jgi:hypothetical protein